MNVPLTVLSEILFFKIRVIINILRTSSPIKNSNCRKEFICNMTAIRVKRINLNLLMFLIANTVKANEKIHRVKVVIHPPNPKGKVCCRKPGYIKNNKLIKVIVDSFLGQIFNRAKNKVYPPTSLIKNI